MIHLRQGRQGKYAGVAALALLAAVTFSVLGVLTEAAPASDDKKPKKVRGRFQTRPGGPLEDVEVEVHKVPVDLPLVEAAQADLEDNELVLGQVVEGQPVAYPIRYLAMFEVIDQRVGSTPLAPTW